MLAEISLVITFFRLRAATRSMCDTFTIDIVNFVRHEPPAPRFRLLLINLPLIGKAFCDWVT